ncbi:MAG TPA: hypothetical protein VGP93_18455, partial [Polyangiaceae bacterium]|nr:hypothetical protein [Polyangiaceae bacterium]
ALSLAQGRVRELLDLAAANAAKVRENPLACSFCDRSQADVAKLIAGRGEGVGLSQSPYDPLQLAYICERCVDLAEEALTGVAEPGEHALAVVVHGADSSGTKCSFCGRPSASERQI